MSSAGWAALAGLGEGLQEAGQQTILQQAEDRKQKRLQEIQMATESRAEQRGIRSENRSEERTIRSEDRASVRAEELAVRKAEAEAAKLQEQRGYDEAQWQHKVTHETNADIASENRANAEYDRRESKKPKDKTNKYVTYKDGADGQVYGITAEGNAEKIGIDGGGLLSAGSKGSGAGGDIGQEQAQAIARASQVKYATNEMLAMINKGDDPTMGKFDSGIIQGAAKWFGGESNRDWVHYAKITESMMLAMLSGAAVSPSEGERIKSAYMVHPRDTKAQMISKMHNLQALADSATILSKDPERARAEMSRVANVYHDDEGKPSKRPNARNSPARAEFEAAKETYKALIASGKTPDEAKADMKARGLIK